MSKEIIVERGTKTVYREGSKIIKQFKAGYPKSAVIKEAFNQHRRRLGAGHRGRRG